MNRPAVPIEDLLDHSAIVAAHPDDEVLWFSSILMRVDQVILVYHDVPSKPALTQGRNTAVAGLPYKQLHTLRLVESEVFEGASWPQPEIRDYGVAVRHTRNAMKGFAAKRYEANHRLLVDKLRSLLVGSKNVFTHNPWGEYGNEEHVQVFRAVASLQDEIGFRLWFSNYASNKSSGLMAQYVTQLSSDVVTLPTDPALGRSLTALYQEAGCWTWFDDYEWPAEETLIAWAGATATPRPHGHVLDMHLIPVQWPPLPRPSKPTTVRQRLRDVKRSIKRLLGRDV